MEQGSLAGGKDLGPQLRTVMAAVLPFLKNTRTSLVRHLCARSHTFGRS